jgi:hypothetical protein
VGGYIIRYHPILRNINNLLIVDNPFLQMLTFNNLEKYRREENNEKEVYLAIGELFDGGIPGAGIMW